MSFHVDLNPDALKTSEMFNMTDERLKELDNIVAHAYIDADNVLMWLMSCVDHAQTLEEVMLLSFTIGMKRGV